MPADRKTNEAHWRTLSGEQFDSCAFTTDRVAVLEMLASQAAISLENANLYSGLQRSEAFLAQGQSLSHTGSFGWNVSTGEIYWSDETYNIFECDRTIKPTLELVLTEFIRTTHQPWSNSSNAFHARGRSSILNIGC